MIALIVNIVAALEALFYLCAIPVHLAVRLENLRAGAGLSAFERGAAIRRAEGDLSSAQKSRQKGPDIRRVWQVLRRLRIDRLEITGRVAMGDAAATALVCGGLIGLSRSLRGRVRQMKVAVRPDFDADAIAVELCGMIRARSGQIILATLKILTEEAFPWISTRLKTS